MAPLYSQRQSKPGQAPWVAAATGKQISHLFLKDHQSVALLHSLFRACPLPPDDWRPAQRVAVDIQWGFKQCA